MCINGICLRCGYNSLLPPKTGWCKDHGKWYPRDQVCCPGCAKDLLTLHEGLADGMHFMDLHDQRFIVKKRYLTIRDDTQLLESDEPDSGFTVCEKYTR